MILGAGVYQLPLILKAREIGLTAIVVSPLGPYPGIEHADTWIDCDVRDKEQVLAVAKQHGISAILTTGSDVSVPAIGYVVDALSLAGTGYLASEICADKLLMKQAFVEHGIRTAKFEIGSTVKQVAVAAEKIGFPLMVKAIDSSGSRGITKVDSVEGLDPAYQAALEVSQSKSVVVEEYLVGEEFGAQAIVIGSKLIDVLCHSDVVTPPPVCVPIGHAMPIELGVDVLDEVRCLVASTVSALNIRDTIANVDIMLVDGKPYLLEIGARMGGTCLPENISLYTGTNAYEFLLRIALGEAPQLDPIYPRTANVGMLITSSKSGVVEHVDIPSEIADSVEWSIDVKEGDEVRQFAVGSDRVGHVIASGASLSDARAIAAEFIDNTRITVSDV